MSGMCKVSRNVSLETCTIPKLMSRFLTLLDVWFDSGSTHAFVLRDREDGSPDGIADL